MRTAGTCMALLLAAAATWADSAPIRTKTAVLYEAGVEGSRNIGTLAQGAVVEILAQNTSFVRVRAADGKVGWVRISALDMAKRVPGAATDGTTGPTPGSGTPTGTPAGTGSVSAGAPKNVGATSEAGKEDFLGSVGGSTSKTKEYAAGKGFNPEIEAGYRKENPNLEPYFAQIDEVLLRMGYNRPESLQTFRRQGYLGEFASAAPGR